MTNEEIDKYMISWRDAMSEGETREKQILGAVIGVVVLLAEIAKRLPEQKEPRSMSDDHADLIESMREKRLAKGLSIRALAEQIGISFSALARLERGIGSPDSNTQARILNWLEAHEEPKDAVIETFGEKE